jgi:hypothetical protein
MSNEKALILLIFSIVEAQIANPKILNCDITKKLLEHKQFRFKKLNLYEQICNYCILQRKRYKSCY